MDAKTNPPAFPYAFQHEDHWKGSEGFNFGMSLRDYFAGQALIGFSATAYDRHKGDAEMQSGGGPAAIARFAYAHADAMLAERERNPE